MIQNSRYFKAVPVYLPVFQSPRFTPNSNKSQSENTACSPRHQSHYFLNKHIPSADLRIKQLRSNNPFNKLIPGERRQSKFNSNSMYGEEQHPPFKPTRRLADFDNPFQRKVLVSSNQNISTDYLNFMNSKQTQELLSRWGIRKHSSDIALDQFPLKNQQQDGISHIAGLGSKIQLHPTPIFNPENQSDHEDVDLRELERQLNFNGQTFKLVDLKRASKL